MKREFNVRNIISKADAIARPEAEAIGLSMWNVEFVREGGIYYLRISVDRDEGVTVEDCEKVCRAVMDKIYAMPELAGRDDDYTLEISSAGIERQLKLPWHFDRFVGSRVLVRLYGGEDKETVGILTSHRDGVITVETGDGERSFELKSTALVRLCPEL